MVRMKSPRHIICLQFVDFEPAAVELERALGLSLRDHIAGTHTPRASEQSAFDTRLEASLSPNHFFDDEKFTRRFVEQSLVV